MLFSISPTQTATEASSWASFQAACCPILTGDKSGGGQEQLEAQPTDQREATPTAHRQCHWRYLGYGCVRARLALFGHTGAGSASCRGRHGVSKKPVKKPAPVNHFVRPAKNAEQLRRETAILAGRGAIKPPPDLLPGRRSLQPASHHEIVHGVLPRRQACYATRV